MAATIGWKTDLAFTVLISMASKASSSGRTSSLNLERTSFNLFYFSSASFLASSSALALASASALALASASALALASAASFSF